jgi:glycosyltransferase involved in cell wall biosynthesis
MVNLTILVPVYNEERAVQATFEDIKNTVKKISLSYEIIAVNDGSKDNSAKILSNIKGIKLINHPYNKGYGASLKTGIKAAKGEWILITDADGTYPIKDIPRLINLIPKYDMVIGARIGEHVKIPLLRKPAKFILQKIANFLTNKKIPDLNSGLRVFRKSIALRFFNLFPSGFSFTTTITLACLTNDYNVKFIPINYYERQGKSTIHPIKDFVKFFNLIIRMTTYFNPFKIFFSISLMLLFLAILVYLYTSVVSNKLMDITVVVIFLSAVQIFLFGLIADLIVKQRK